MAERVPDCQFLVENKFCSSVLEGEGKIGREEGCTNNMKESCCYLCNKRDSCEISCNYLGEEPPMVASASYKCSTCGTLNPVGSKFCKRCGTTVQISGTCPKCGNKLDSDSLFCQQCGFQVSGPRNISVSRSGMRRLPFGLEFLIALGAIGALFYFASSVMFFWATTTAFGQIPGVAETLVFSGAVYLIVAFLQITVSWGLWSLKGWARNALILVCILNLVSVFGNLVYGIVGLVYSLIVLWYVNTREVKSLFTLKLTGAVSTMPVPAHEVSQASRVCPTCGRKGRLGQKFCVKCGSEMKDV